VTFILGAIAWAIARKSWRTRYWPLASATHPALTGFDAQNVRCDRTTRRRRSTGTSRRGPGPPSANRSGQRAQGGLVPSARNDDPEFLRMLDRLISGTSDSGELSGILTILFHEPTGGTATDQA